MSLAGQQLDDKYEFDGVPIPIYEGFTDSPKQENMDVETWGQLDIEGQYSYSYGIASSIGTYKSVRVIGESYSLYYSVWCSNAKEYYNMEADPRQVTNLLSSNATATAKSKAGINGRPFSTVLGRVDALLMVLKSCMGKHCIQPWSQLHPTGDVKTLAEALKEEYDDFYASQPRVSFTKCETGYILSSEGPQGVNTYASNLSNRATPEA